MVLSALCMFLLALMMVMSFNVSHAVHEKVRLQQHSDAQAYSMAVVQARALNYFAYSNRAVAAALVSMNNLHAYQSLASIATQYMKAGQYNMYIIAGLEFLQCICIPPCLQHCAHGFEAISKAGKFSQAATKWANRAKALEGSFRLAVQALQLLINSIHLQQKLVYAETMSVLSNGQSYDLDKLKAVNAPRATDVNTAICALNMNSFSCAIDGAPCIGGKANRSAVDLSKELTSVANGSRNKWAATRSGWPIIPPTAISPIFLYELMFSIQGNGMSVPLPSYKGTAKTTGTSGLGNIHGGRGNQGTTSAADEHGGGLLTYWRDGIWPYMPVSGASIYSDKNGGGHTPSNTHSGQHKFEGANAKTYLSCIFSGSCFTSFRPDDDPKNDFNQPTSYSSITMQMRMGNVEQAPWELSNTGTLRSDIGGSATMRLAAGDGAAVSKAKVYFHRLGAWQAPPNMFDPYWRAKLHPFKQVELIKVLALSGNMDGAQLAASVPTLPY